MKRLLKIALFLLMAAGAYFFYIKNTSVVTSWLMIFNQNSTQSIMGWINKAENPALMILFLSAFQAFAMPWKSTPRIVIASAAIFGFVPAVILCLLGRLIAVALWYLIGWLLLGFKLKCGKGTALVYGAISCIFPSWAVPAAIITGAVSANFKFCLAAALVAHLPVLAFPAKFANIYSSIIPSWCGNVMYILAAVLLALGIYCFVKRK